MSKIKSKSKHINSNFHSHKNNFTAVVKEYEFIRPDENKIDNVFKNCARVGYNKSFHRFMIIYKYDIEMTNGDYVNGIFSDKKLRKIVRENGLLHKLTIKLYGNLSNINKCYYLKLRIPLCLGRFSRTISQNPENVKTHCNGINISFPFQFASGIQHSITLKI